jgi:UrcA family protein
MESNGESRHQRSGDYAMNTSIFTNNRRSSLLATFAIGAIALISARAQADDPAQVDQVTISSPTENIVGRDTATNSPITQTTRTARIQYDPVTLTTNSGVALLQDSVRESARKLCDSIVSLDSSDGTCIRTAVESAKPQVDAAIARARSTVNG